MKKLKLILILGFISVLTNSTYAQSNNELDLKKLLQEFQLNTENWRQAYNSNDAQNLVPLYTEDADYISSHVLGLEAIGRDKLIANFQNGMNMGGHIDSIEILKMNVSCDIATLLCKYTATNSGVTVTGRNLLVMKKINGKWLISLHMTVV
jgi:ketosteroid isomerase-like protein